MFQTPETKIKIGLPFRAPFTKVKIQIGIQTLGHDLKFGQADNALIRDVSEKVTVEHALAVHVEENLLAQCRAEVARETVRRGVEGSMSVPQVLVVLESADLKLAY